MTPRTKTLWSVAACLFVSGAAAFAVARFVPLGQVAAVLQKADVMWIGAGIALSLLTRLAAIQRTYVIASGMGLPLTRFAVFDALFAANFWSLVLPGVSAGSVVTVHKYRSHGVSIAEGVGALSASRAIELAAFSALCLIGFYYGSAAAPRNTVALPAALLLIVVALLMAMRRCAHRFSQLLERRSDDSRFRSLLALSARPFAAYARITQASLLRAFAAGAVQVFLEAATLVALARSVDVSIGLASGLSISGLAYLASLLPLSIAGIGIRDAAVLAATAPLGIPAHAAVAIATLMLGTVILNGLLGGLLQLILPWYPPQARRGDGDSRRPSFTNTPAN